MANKVCENIGKKNWIRVEADGFSGGIWILWDGDLIDPSVIHAHKQFVNLSLTLNTGGGMVAEGYICKPQTNAQSSSVE